MRKIPTLFVRDPDDMRHVLPEVHPECGWVLAGEGVATRKYDGTCVMFDDDGRWWARREVKPGKAAPAGFVELDHDPVTEKRVGWEPAEQSGWAKWLRDAIDNSPQPMSRTTYRPELFNAGTYELCGPKVNGNPERFDHHVLIRHDHAQPFPEVQLSLGRAVGAPVEEIRDYLAILLTTMHGPGGKLAVVEGIVWHHPDGRMAKLKARDFR
jgi:hypothetical protein